VPACSFCGRENDAASRFCIDCGKPVTASAARVGAATSSGTSGGTGDGGGATGGASGPTLANKAGVAPSPISPAAPAGPALPQPYNAGVGVAAERPVPSALPSIAPAPAPALTPSPAKAQGGVPPKRSSSPARSAAPPTRCPRCTKPVDSSAPYCPHCGTRVAPAGAGTCGQCGANFLQGVDVFCARCGNRVGQRVSVEMNTRTPGLVVPPVSSMPVLGSETQGILASRRDAQPRLALLDDEGAVAKTFILERGDAVIGRGDADMRFESDPYMSPLHARIELRGGQLWLRDLGSRNGSWLFIDGPTRLTDGDLVLVGSQILRFRRLGYPGPHPPEADSTRRLGSLVPAADVAVIEQLRADGSVRDMLHLSPGRSVMIGRETGDWLFPYDQTMSGRHAEVRSEDSEYYIHDAGSRNGVAMAVRGERALRRGQRLLLGNEILRVESA